MKISLLLLSLILLGSFGAYASVNKLNGPLDSLFLEAETIHEKSYFEILGELYTTGELPSFKKIVNIAWAGRCFKSTDPRTPINGGYIFRVAAKPDVGPLGKDIINYEASSYWNETKAPNHWDKMNLRDVLSQNPGLIFHPVKLNSSSIVTSVSDSLTSSLRVSGSYLVEELTDLLSNDVGPIGGPVERSVALRCYYFIPELAN